MKIKNLGFKVPSSFHSDLKSTAAQHGLTMVALLALAFDLAKRHLADQGGSQ